MTELQESAKHKTYIDVFPQILSISTLIDLLS